MMDLNAANIRISRENIKAEQAIRKRKREQIKRDIQHGLAPILAVDVSALVASFVRIKLPISQGSIDEIAKVFANQ